MKKAVEVIRRYFWTMRNISSSTQWSLTWLLMWAFAWSEPAGIVDKSLPATFLQSAPARMMGGILI